MGGMARADRVRTGTNPTRRHSQSSITTRWLGQGEARNTRASVECESETVSCEGKQVCKISGLRCLCTYLVLIVIGLKQGLTALVLPLYLRASPQIRVLPDQTLRSVGLTVHLVRTLWRHRATSDAIKCFQSGWCLRAQGDQACACVCRSCCTA